MRAAVLAGILWLAVPAVGWAEWQAKPFIGVTFGGETTFLALDQVAGERKLALGAGVTWLGNFIGIEGEITRVPGFFQRGRPLDVEIVTDSSVTTATGSVVLTLPRKMTQYGLRPYFVGGAGVVRAVASDPLDLLSVDTTLGVANFGGGVTGFLTDRVGVNWDVRYFRSFGGKEGTGLAIGREQLSFWRASMGVAIRLGATPGSTP
jgi:hypothetical protein